MTESGGCCRCCTGFIFSSGLTALFLWLSLRPSKPSYSVEKFYIPALNKSVDDPRNTTVFLSLRMKNSNKDKGIYYDALNVSLYHGDNLSFIVGNVEIPGFYQGHKKKAYKEGSFPAVGVPWDTSRKEVSNGTTVFRVNLTTAVRYKILFWKTRHHKMNVAGNVTVNDQGSKSSDKGVNLSSAGVKLHHHLGVLLSLCLLYVIFSFFWF